MPLKACMIQAINVLGIYMKHFNDLLLVSLFIVLSSIGNPSVRALLSRSTWFMISKVHIFDATVLCSSSLEFQGAGKICKTFQQSPLL